MAFIHLDLIGGLAGDMFIAAAIDANLINVDDLTTALRTLGLGDEIIIKTKKSRRGALAGTHVTFAHWDFEANAHYRYLTTILEMISQSSLPESVKNRAASLFNTLGESEAKVHGIPLEKVHFHEVGAVDSILDFVSAAWIIEHAGNGRKTKWSVNTIPTGYGMVETAHGSIPLPVPAVSNLLVGFELQTLPIMSELVTPTGAAILVELHRSGMLTQQSKSSEHNHIPQNLRLKSMGYGLGTKDFGEHSNAVRLMLYDRIAPTTVSGSLPSPYDISFEKVIKLSCEIDDMQPEILSYVCNDVLPAMGAIDVTRTPIVMKQGRTAIQLQVLTPIKNKDQLIRTLLYETTTLGVRIETIERAVLDRKVERLDTSLGPIDIKISGDYKKAAPEYRSLVEISEKKEIPLMEVWHLANHEITNYLKERHRTDEEE